MIPFQVNVYANGLAREMSDVQELTKIKNELVSEPGHEIEPVLNSKPVTTIHCEDDGDEDIEPLSGESFFHIFITKSHVGFNYKYQLIVPSQFARTLPNTRVRVRLIRGRRSWEMAYHGENSMYNKIFDSGWKSFAEDNKLKIGDACVFELMNHTETALEFKVQVLRGDFPSSLVDNKQIGSRDNPIVVD